jgi:hypothetical protein
MGLAINNKKVITNLMEKMKVYLQQRFLCDFIFYLMKIGPWEKDCFMKTNFSSF